MAQDHYEFRVAGDYFYYPFTSDGIKGPVKKLVEFTPMSTTNNVPLFNLVFGDYDEATGKLDDISVTDNKDTLKVLSTVAHIVSDFTERYPNVAIYAKGSTDSRSRLYQMAINKHWEEINAVYDVYGEVQGKVFIRFIAGINFTAFVAMRKNSNFIT